MNLSSITPLILTYNEELNIGRCLERLTWAQHIVVIDSGSTDRTLEICASFPNVRVIHRPFDNHTAQWNFGLDQIETPRVLSLDADYILNEDFVAELKALPEDSDAHQIWYAGFHFVIFGKRLRGTILPPRAVLFHPQASRYEQDGHTQALQIEYPSSILKAKIDHDDRKSLTRWLESQKKYAMLEVEKLLACESPTGMPDRLRKMIWPAAPAAFFYTLLVKRIILDGWPGWFYVLQRTYAELLLSLLLLEKKLFSPR
jgi:glycosyltransferase involved in cell wall biosynthesis